jgi:hypothetical protein
LSGAALPLLVSARQAGLTLRLDGDRLMMTGQGVKPPDALLAELRAGRDALIRALRAEAGEAMRPDPPAAVEPARAVPIRPPGLSAEDRDGLIAAALLRPTSWADPAEALKAMGIAPPPKFPDDFGKNGGA